MKNRQTKSFIRPLIGVITTLYLQSGRGPIDPSIVGFPLRIDEKLQVLKVLQVEIHARGPICPLSLVITSQKPLNSESLILTILKLPLRFKPRKKHGVANQLLQCGRTVLKTNGCKSQNVPKRKWKWNINNLGWVLLLDLFHEFTSKVCIGLPQKSKSS